MNPFDQAAALSFVRAGLMLGAQTAAVLFWCWLFYFLWCVS